jgi:hypothetical protein
MSDPSGPAAPPPHWPVRLLFAVYSLCFLGASFNHTRDLWEGGFLPYRNDPLPFNVYWTSLTLLDTLAVVLLWTVPRAGLVLAGLIMVSDVAINSIATYYLDQRDLFDNVTVPAQALFCLFVLATAPWAWKRVR